MGIKIGNLETSNCVFLAPMSGVTDVPFRAIAHDHGAGLVTTEMVASEELVSARPDMVRRSRGAGRIRPFVIQLAGREARWMSEGARVAQDLGADVIDINMGCPARQVTGGLSGSALMRDLDHAVTLIEATVSASRVPVTVKMRLGWDSDTKNAPELARRAETSGAAMVTVHGRTRCQFYKGSADWAAIRAVRDAVKIPVIANGDCRTVADAKRILESSGADGVMIGRGAYGRPWWPGVVARAFASGKGSSTPSLAEEGAIVQRHLLAIHEHYRPELGNRVARKHVGWTVERLLERNLISQEISNVWRKRLLANSHNADVLRGIAELYESCTELAAA